MIALTIIAALLAVLLLWGMLWRRLVAPYIDASAKFSKASVVYGGSFEFTIAIHNPTNLPAPLVTCEFELPRGISTTPLGSRNSSDKDACLISTSVSLRPRERVTLRYTLYGVHRGKHRLSNCTLQMSNGFTQGFQFKKVFVDEPVVVHPQKHEYPISSRAVSRVGTRQAIRKLYPTSQDWIDLRPYRPGDSVRDIHWMSSARRGELIVLERASSVANHAVVVVSTQVSRDFWTPNERVAEAVLNTAYALLLRLLRDDSKFVLYTNVASRRGAGAMGRHHLLTIEGTNSPKVEFQLGHTIGSLPIYAHTELSKVLSELDQAVHEPTRIFVVTGYEDDEMHQRLIRLSRAGHRVETILVRPDDASDVPLMDVESTMTDRRVAE